MNIDRLRAVSGLEFYTILRRPFWWILLTGAAFTVLSLSSVAVLPKGDGFVGSISPYINSEYALTSFFGLSSFVLYGFFAAVVGGLAVIRDDEHQISDLLHSTPLTPSEYVFGKYLGVVSALALVLLIQTLLLIGFYEITNGVTGTTGPFDLWHYVKPSIVFSLIPIMGITGLTFAVGERSRRPLVVLAIPVAMIFLLPVFAMWNPPGLANSVNTMLKVLDPSGLRWLIQDVIAHAETVEQVNTESVSLTGTILFNRLVLLFGAIVAVASCIPHVKKVVAMGGAPAKRGLFRQKSTIQASSTSPQISSETPDRLRPIIHRSITTLETLGMRSEQTSFDSTIAEILKCDLVELAKQPALYLLIPLFLSTSLEKGSTSLGPFGEPLLLTTGTLSISMFSTLTFMLCAVMLFFTVESIRREQSNRFDQLLYAFPIRTSAIIVAKNLASVILVIFLLVLIGLGASVLIWIKSKQFPELWNLAVVWGAVLLPTLVFWNAFVTAVCAMVRSRYTTYAIGIIALVWTLRTLQSGTLTWVGNWTAIGTLRWSDMGTFSLNGSPLLLNRLMVLAAALFLAVVAVRLFPRIAVDTVAAADRLRRYKLAKTVARIIPFMLLPLVIAGSLKLQIRSGFQSGTDARADHEYWLRNVETWSNVPMPSIDHVDLKVNLVPTKRKFDLSGSYRMTNRTDSSLNVIAFTIRRKFGEVDWKIEGESPIFENRSGLHVLALHKPLAAGQSIDIGFSYAATYPRGFTKNGGGIDQFVLPSGVLLHTLRNSFLPSPGFNDTIGATSRPHPEPAQVRPDFWEKKQYRKSSPFTTSLELTAPADYTFNTVGTKVSDVVSDDIRTVVFTSDKPVGSISIVGGKWDSLSSGKTAVFYHPKHHENAIIILSALVAAREHYSDWFGEYPWQELRVNEYPNYNRNAIGFPTNIPFSESIGFLSHPGARISTPFIVAAHEAAHQWWGNMLAAGDGPGTDHLIEGMATYASALLVEEEHGPDARAEFARRLESSYVRRHRPDTEKPLIAMVDHNNATDRAIIFEKGALVQWMMHEEFGRQAMTNGLKTFIANSASENILPTLHDMLNWLRPHSADTSAYDRFVDQWFYSVVLPEFKIFEPVVIPPKAGDHNEWIVAATIKNVGTGHVRPLVAIEGVTRPNEGDSLERTRKRTAASITLGAGESKRIELRSTFAPIRIVVDPDINLLQTNRSEAQLDLQTLPD